jgi:dTDP-4-amino-4,6-dideoxygalactose transaminase
MYQGHGPFPVAEELAASGISLPTWNGLDDAAIARVCGEVAEFLEETRA